MAKVKKRGGRREGIKKSNASTNPGKLLVNYHLLLVISYFLQYWSIIVGIILINALMFSYLSDNIFLSLSLKEPIHFK